MHSAGFSGLHLGDQEIRIRHFHHVLDGYVPADGGSGGAGGGAEADAGT
jgi:hypothetical protein